MRLQNIKFAIIGIGYFGLPLATEFGHKRFVVGFDNVAVSDRTPLRQLCEYAEKLVAAVFPSTRIKPAYREFRTDDSGTCWQALPSLQRWLYKHPPLARGPADERCNGMQKL